MLVQSRTHLREAGEGYLQHLRFAALVGVMLVAAGIACVLHAIIPAVCTRTASRMVERLARLFKDRSALPEIVRESSGALAFVLLLALSLPLATVLLLFSSHLGYGGPLALLTLAVPAAFLWSNPGLESVE